MNATFQVARNSIAEPRFRVIGIDSNRVRRVIMGDLLEIIAEALAKTLGEFVVDSTFRVVPELEIEN